MPPQSQQVQAAGQPAAATGNGQQQQRNESWTGTIVKCVMMFFFLKQFFGGGAKKPQPNVQNRHDMYLPKFNRSQPMAAHNNATVYLHAVFARPGSPTSPREQDFDPDTIFWKTHALTAYLPEMRNKTGVNLLSSKDDSGSVSTQEKQKELAAAPRRIISYLKPNMTVAVVDDFQVYGAKAIPAQIAPHMSLDPVRMEYAPTLFFNEFWLLRDHLIPLNETVDEVTLHFSLSGMSMWKWTIFTQMEQSFNMQQSWGAMGEGESDELKRVLLEGNPIYLAITFVVSLLHSVFDFFAFKNDIGFWRNKKSVEGLSVRTVGINCFCQLIIFLYLLDSETSMVIIASSGIGTAIEFWKVTKAMDVTINRSGRFPMLHFKDKQGYDNASKTKQYDAEAIQYTSYLVYPLVACYAVYALIYKTHKSWYSWLLSSLVGAVYSFGFIMMVPQLYINYKLKSVAALPWRQMTFKFLNTIIDDLFAFVIKMPLLHRLSVFRDDVIFLIYLYQRWIYRVDKRRANEFGHHLLFAAEDRDAEEDKFQATEVHLDSKKGK
eukprot:jgi/Astpho2/7997/fgenesh1_pm.00119_%23_6_t